MMIQQIYVCAQDVVRDGGRMLLDVAGNKTVKVKDGISNFATMIDYRVQEHIVGELERIIPGCNIITEESTDNVYNMDKPTWVLDPLDGTINIAHNFRYSAISLALFINHEPAFGIVYNPYANEMFHAMPGKGAYMNDTKIYASKTTAIKDSLISFGTTPYDRSRADITFNNAKNMFLNCQDVRRSGAAALDIAYTACGRVDGFFELCLQPWDYAAGMLILDEAGGRFTNWQGDRPNPSKPTSVLATNGLIHSAMMEIITNGDT